MSGTARRTVTICNDKGLHARASAKFVGLVARFPDEVSVAVLKDGHSVPGGSIMGLMMLGAAKGSDIDIQVEGPDAELYCAKLVGLVMDGFGE